MSDKEVLHIVYGALLAIGKPAEDVCRIVEEHLFGDRNDEKETP